MGGPFIRFPYVLKGNDENSFMEVDKGLGVLEIKISMVGKKKKNRGGGVALILPPLQALREMDNLKYLRI